MEIHWIVWLLFAVVIVLIACVVVLFVTKASKNSQNNGSTGPQGVQGVRGDFGRQGQTGSQGVNGGTGVLLTQVPVTVQLQAVTNMVFPNNQGSINNVAVMTVIGNILTFQFSQVPVVMSFSSQIVSSFVFDVVLPSGFQLAETNPVKLFDGICLTNRQSNVNATPIYLSDFIPVSANSAMRLTFTSQEGQIWTGIGTQPTLTCNFNFTLMLAT